MDAVGRWRQSIGQIQQLLANPASHEQALSLARATLAQAEQDFGEANERVLASLNLLASALKHNAQFDEAHAAYQRCIDHCLRNGQARSMSMAVLWGNLGSLFLAQSNYDEATRHYQRALELKRELVGPTHASVASSLCDLAHVEEQRGDLETAMDLYIEGFELFCAADPDGRPPESSFGAVAACAGTLKARGEYEAALRGYLALRAGWPTLGVEAFVVQCLIALGRPQEALSHLLVGLERPRARQSAGLWRMLGLLRLAVERDAAAAAQAWSNALEVDPLFGDRHPDIATFVSMHRTMAAIGRASQARIQHVDLETGQFVVVF